MQIRKKLLWNFMITSVIVILAVNVTITSWPRPSIALPVNPAQLDYSGASYLIWPYGVRGGGHPEGHPGIDFSFNFSAPIHTACDALVTAITPNQSHPGTSTIDTIPIGYPFVIVRYDELVNVTVTTLSTVKQGYIVGHAQNVGGFYMFHFGIQHTQNLWTNVPESPELYFNDTALSIIGRSIWEPGTLMNKSSYAERNVSPYLTTKETADFYAKNGSDGWIVLMVIIGALAATFFIMNSIANKKQLATP
ncbi:MAG TPA: hypothetical protein VKM55_03660 [Candidatus Lokiarchaeia archaeon]|nr:hypothetical protein [Candidatus Lokiarchaeia archaeon]